MSGVTPSVWGEPAWRFMHAVALGYPSSGPDLETRARYRAFYENLRGVLPCDSCRRGYTVIFAAIPIDDALASGSDALFRWTVDVHNEVAKKLGKPAMSAQFVRESYIFGVGSTVAAPAP